MIITDDSLVQAIGDVRKALGERGRDIVRTVPRRGYMLVAQAESAATPQVTPPPFRSALRARRRTEVGVFAAIVLAGLTLAGIVVIWPPRLPGGGETVGFGGRQSIAVLAFKDPSGSVDGQFLARGLAEVFHQPLSAFGFGPVASLNPSQQPLADATIRYWAALARTGRPADPLLPAWPRYSSATPSVQRLVPGAIAATTLFGDDHHCGFWASFGV